MSADASALQPVTLRLGSGAAAQILPFGAHVLSWTLPDAGEQLYLSPRAALDGSAPIRGGVPICFPQFNQRALQTPPLPKHGLARTAPWRLLAQGIDATDGTAGAAAQAVTPCATSGAIAGATSGAIGGATSGDHPSGVPGEVAWAEFGWSSGDVPVGIWPHRFAARYRVELRADALALQFTLHNTDVHAWPFALALHTYLRVADIAATQVHGLQGCNFWDAVAHGAEPTRRSCAGPEALCFAGETDRVYTLAAQALQVRQAGQARTLHITQSANLTEAVVWNPGATLASQLADLPPDGYRHMLCVEAARIDQPVLLEPGATWTAWQTLRSSVAPMA